MVDYPALAWSICWVMSVVSCPFVMSLALSSKALVRSQAAFILSSVIWGSCCLSPALKWLAVASNTFFPVQLKMNWLLDAVALRASAAAILASTATSGEGPFNSDRKKLGQRLARSSLKLV